ncbi:MAG: hypothetical protein LUD72_08460 [Bacteroidales bacterium]|nr:hypothetical protein [Bacteroidales bacterium]
MSIGEGAFSGWTESQTITVDASRFYAGRKWMTWPSKNSSVESADDMWLYGNDAVVVYDQAT